MEENEKIRLVADLHKKIGPLVLRRCQTLVKDEAGAEDATQEVFVRILEKIDDFRGEASPTSWIYRIATNVCIDELRRRARRTTTEFTPQLQEALSVEGSTPEGRVLGQNELRHLFGKTDPVTLQVLVHIYLDEMSQEEVAQLLNISRKTVWTKLDRVRRRLERISR